MNNQENNEDLVTINWKPITEIPTKHWEHNNAISSLYLVHCGYNKNGLAVIGYACYSFATNQWMKCYDSTDRSNEFGWNVEKWTEIKL